MSAGCRTPRRWFHTCDREWRVRRSVATNRFVGREIDAEVAEICGRSRLAVGGEEEPPRRPERRREEREMSKRISARMRGDLAPGAYYRLSEHHAALHMRVAADGSDEFYGWGGCWIRCVGEVDHDEAVYEVIP